MWGQLHQTIPGSGVLSHHLSQEPPRISFALLSTSAYFSGDSYSKASAASVSTPPRRNTVVRKYEPPMKGAPALEATTRSPLQSMTTSPRMDWRSSLVSQTMPRLLSPTRMGEENHEWSRRWMPPSRARSSEARFQPSGSNAAA